MTFTEDGQTYTCDRTYQQIADAFADGKKVLGWLATNRYGAGGLLYAREEMQDQPYCVFSHIVVYAGTRNGEWSIGSYGLTVLAVNQQNDIRHAFKAIYVNS